MRRGVAWVVASVAIASGGCQHERVRVEFFDDELHSFSWSEARRIRAIAGETADEARGHLPALSQQLYLRVHPARPHEVLEATGEGGAASAPDTIVWSVDSSRAGGVTAVAEAELRACLFHEFHHLVRDSSTPRRTMLDYAVTEGMATAFERDYAEAQAPWGWYPAEPEVEAWIEELRWLPDDVDRGPWLGKHLDGRRWIARKAGTYLVDRAVRASGKSPAALVATPTAEILRLAGR